MKKSMLFAAIIAVLCFSVNTSAQSKYEIKDAKKAAKVLQKEGWKTNGGTRSIESYLIAYNQLAVENELLQGRSSGIKGNNTKVAQSLAKQNALREYVQMNNSFFEGVGNELEGKVGGETIDNITNAVKSKFVGSVEGKMNATRLVLKAFASFVGYGGELPLPQVPAPCPNVVAARSLPEALLRIYTPFADSCMLKANPAAFEELRNNYALRREPDSYELCVKSVIKC